MAGIVADHVHLVLELPRRFDISRLVQGLKGASARIANREGLMPRAPLRWAEGYDVRSVGVRQLPRALAYVQGQAARHPDRAIAAMRPSGRHAASRDFSPSFLPDRSSTPQDDLEMPPRHPLTTPDYSEAAPERASTPAQHLSASHDL
jgi:hypothetical protein